MTRTIWLTALLLLPCLAAAQSHAARVVTGFDGRAFPTDPSLQPAAQYTPDPVSQTAGASGWIEFADSPQARLWMAYMADAKQPHVAWVALKQAEKGVSRGITGMTILSGQVLCGTDGSAPNYAHIVTAFKYAANGAPIAAEGPVGTFALTPDTQFAVAIQQACRHLPKIDEQVAGDYKPDANYPPGAIRQRHEGVTVVGYRVGEGGTIGTANVWVVTSSGFNELDTAALAAVSQWRLKSATPGTKATINITFSLNAGMHAQYQTGDLFQRMDQADRSKSNPR